MDTGRGTMAATAMGAIGMSITAMVEVVMGAAVTDGVVMVAMATVATARVLISETAIFTVTVHSGPGSPIPVIISHGHQAHEAMTPGSSITYSQVAARNRNMPDKTRAVTTSKAG
jgi:hypothetical protein